MENLLIALIIIAGLCIAGIALIWFLRLSKQQQMEMLKQWLILAVVQAEKELGGGTGAVKLRYVYDMFIKRFKFISKIITFEQFSALVDEALEVMRLMIQNNKNVVDYINK